MNTAIVKSSKLVKSGTSVVRSHLDAVDRARQIYLSQIKRAESEYFDRIKRATEILTEGEATTPEVPEVAPASPTVSAA